MPRSAVDATRFTAASPHVYTKPNLARPSPSTSTYSSLRQPLHPSQSNPNSRSPHPSQNETPQQKVARLRAMRSAQRQAELPLFERIVIRGRAIADRAHRITAISLICFSILAVGVAGFAITDMLVHNRRKRNAFYDQQHRIYTSKVVAAIETEKAGLPLTNDQQLVMNRERMKFAQEEEKKAQRWSAKLRRLLLGGLKEEEDPRQALGLSDGLSMAKGRVPTEGEVLDLLGLDKLEMLKEASGKDKSNPQQSRKGQNVDRSIGEETRSQALRKGGILDQMADNAFRRVGGR